jgi:3-hydroxyacyl-CoA dehydrogenase
MSPVEYRVQGAIAVITLANPPVNSLSLALRQALDRAIKDAEADPVVRACVLIGSDKAFSGGADIKEFGTDKAVTRPRLRDIIDDLDQTKKPIVAALGGFALGGGFELTMACHYRVVKPGTRIALPEITLGLIPGGGGTVRLPRLMPVERATDMILSGSPIKVEDALKLGLVDAIIEGDLLAGAVKFAEELVAAGKGPRHARDLQPRLDDKAFFDNKRAELKQSARGRVAPLANLEAIEAAVKGTPEAGQDFATATFLRLMAGTESKALRYSFLAEREAARIPDIPADTPLRDIKSAAVIGAGTMGGGIAMCFANAGIAVTVIEAKQEALDRGLATIRKNYAATVARGRLTQDAMDKRMALIGSALGLSAAAQADIVVEAVFEEMSVKQSVFKELDKVAKAGAILATNTSTLDVDQIAAVTSRPQDVIGAHFFSPANVMRLLEVIRGAKTARDVVATTMALGKKLGKVAVLSGICDGFIGNRMLEKYRVQTIALMEEGADPQQIDAALTNWGFAMGPFAVSDLAGNDIGWAVRKRRKAEGKNFTPNPVADKLCELGRFGQKAGKGWYRYEPGNRKPLTDPEVEQLIAAHRQSLGLKPRAISDEEIVDRCLFALANEGAKIVEEGIALRASDVDLVYLNGYGFPSYRGGPMFNADVVGLPKVLEKIKQWAKGHQGDAWQPSALLVKLAGEGGKFTPQ